MRRRTQGTLADTWWTKALDVSRMVQTKAFELVWTRTRSRQGTGDAPPPPTTTSLYSLRKVACTVHQQQRGEAKDKGDDPTASRGEKGTRTDERESEGRRRRASARRDPGRRSISRLLAREDPAERSTNLGGCHASACVEPVGSLAREGMRMAGQEMSVQGAESSRGPGGARPGRRTARASARAPSHDLQLHFVGLARPPPTPGRCRSVNRASS
jgi:hypothetical protein